MSVLASEAQRYLGFKRLDNSSILKPLTITITKLNQPECRPTIGITIATITITTITITTITITKLN